MAVATIVSVLGARSFLVQYDTGAAERAAALDALNAAVNNMVAAVRFFLKLGDGRAGSDFVASGLAECNLSPVDVPFRGGDRLLASLRVLRCRFVCCECVFSQLDNFRLIARELCRFFAIVQSFSIAFGLQMFLCAIDQLFH